MSNRVLGKKPLKSDEFFDLVIKQMEKENIITPETQLDYTLASRYDAFLIEDDDFWIEATADFGSSEGIYIDAVMCEHTDTGYKKRHIGTLKTLNQQWEDLEQMSVLAVRFRRCAETIEQEYRLKLARKGFALIEPIETDNEDPDFQYKIVSWTPYGCKDTSKLEPLLEKYPGSFIVNLETREKVS